MCATPNIVVFLSLISAQNPIPRTRRLFGACLLPENRTFSLKWCLAHPNLLPFLGEYEKSLEKFGFSYMWLWYLQTPLSNVKFGVESDKRHQKSIWNIIPLQNQTFRAKTCLAHPNSIGGAPSVWKITFFMNLDTTWFQTDADQVYRWNLKWCSLAVVLLKRRARVTSSSTLPAFPPRPWPVTPLLPGLFFHRELKSLLG